VERETQHGDVAVDRGENEEYDLEGDRPRHVGGHWVDVGLVALVKLTASVTKHSIACNDEIGDCQR